MSLPITRRKFASGFAAAAIAGIGSNVPVTSLVAASFKSDPFTLGVASGDPSTDGFVIWTRLLPEPPHSMSIPAADYEVAYEISDTAGFRTVLQTGRIIARRAAAHSVHVEIGGLQPARDYFYRFIAGGARSAAGRARTLPDPGANTGEIRFAVAGCQHYQAGYYTAYRHLAAEQFDFVFHYGDYIYERIRRKPWKNTALVRAIPLPFQKARTLDEYRALYAFYKYDPDLKAAHASAPFIPSFDDHEVENDWQGGAEGAASARALRAAAFQAWYEHMPLRNAQRPSGAGIQAYRAFRIGRLAAFNVLDTRQYRTGWPCTEKWADCRAAAETKRSLLGHAQEAWLFDRLRRSDTAWNILAQQVMMMRYDRDPDPEATLQNMDKWDGATAGRDRLFKAIGESGVPGVVTLTGDVHDNWAGDLKADFDEPLSPTLGVEFVATSISSGGDGGRGIKRFARIRKGNPHVKYFNNQRGYVRHTVGAKMWRADFRVVARVSAPDDPITTAKSMITERLRLGVIDG